MLFKKTFEGSKFQFCPSVHTHLCCVDPGTQVRSHLKAVTVDVPAHQQQLQCFMESFPVRLNLKVKWRVVDIFCSTVEFTALWCGAGNRCYPSHLSERPPHPSPDTHTHHQTECTACRGRAVAALFQQQFPLDVRWSVFHLSLVQCSRRNFLSSDF